MGAPLGPAGAPLVPEVIAHFKANPPTLGYSENGAIMLGSVGPAARESLPLLTAWLQASSGKSHTPSKTILLQTAMACVEGTPRRAVAPLKQALAAALAPNGESLAYPLLDAVGIAYQRFTKIPKAEQEEFLRRWVRGWFGQHSEMPEDFEEARATTSPWCVACW